MLLASGRLAVFAAIHASLAATGFVVDHVAVWLLVWCLQSVNFLTIVGIVHESAHQHFFDTNRWANRVVGTLAATFGLTCFEAYRAQHIMHHAHTCGEGDTEGEPYKFTARWQILGAYFGGGLFYSMLVLVSGVRVAFGWTPSWLSSERQRRRIRVNVGVLTAVIAATGAAVVFDVVSLRSLAFVWLIPALAALLGPIPYVLIPEHYDAAGPGATVTNTRTCVSNPVLRFFYLNTNLHTAHHDRPAVPWHQLEAHHATIEPDIESEWLFPSYAAFHRWMWNTTSRPAAHTTAPT